jgi:DNA-binding FadR family transcriptional regulator
MGSADRGLHLQIVQLSRNAVLFRLAEGYRVLGMAVRASREPRALHKEHLQIADAIRRNLPDEAERIARQHVAEARHMIEQLTAKNQFNPNWVVSSKPLGFCDRAASLGNTATVEQQHAKELDG